MMRKTRRTYVQPTSEVVELHVTNQLLAGSTGTGSFESNPEEVDME